MKNSRLLIIVSVIVVAFVIIALIWVKQESPESSFSIQELKQLMEQYGENSPLVAEYLEKYKNSEELEKQIVALRNSNRRNVYRNRGSGSGGRDGENSKANSSKNKKRAGTSNNSSDNQFASDDNSESYSDYLGDEKSADESTDGNSSSDPSSYSGLQAIQEMMDNLPSRSNDFIVRLDKDANGLNINTTNREARVSLDLLNSDLFENGAFSNAPGIWITGLSKFENATTYEALWYDYKNKFIEIPGVGIYLMKDNLSDEAFAARKVEILNELINKKPNDKLYNQLAKTFAGTGNMDAASETIAKWAKNSDKVNYDYQMAEVYRINGENSNNSETSQEYLQKAVDYYKQASSSPEIARKTALSLAKTYEKLGDMDSAINTLESSYDYGKNKQWKDNVAVQLGNYYSKTGDDYAALDSYKKSPQPGFINKVRQAEIYQRCGDTQSAIDYYEKAIKYKRNDSYIPMLNLGVLYFNNGNKAKTEKIYNKINNRIKDFSSKRKKEIKNSSAYKKIKDAAKN